MSKNHTKCYLLCIFLALLLFLFSSMLQGCHRSKKNESGPFHTYIASLKKPVLIDFGSTGCTPCKLMEPILEELKKDYSDQFETIFVLIQSEPEKVKEFGIQVIPTQFFFNEKGKQIFSHIGFFSKEDILQTFRKQGIPVN